MAGCGNVVHGFCSATVPDAPRAGCGSGSGGNRRAGNTAKGSTMTLLPLGASTVVVVWMVVLRLVAEPPDPVAAGRGNSVGTGGSSMSSGSARTSRVASLDATHGAPGARHTLVCELVLLTSS